MASILAGAATHDVADISAGATTPDPFIIDQAASERDLDASSSPDWGAAIARYRAGTAAARARLAPGTVHHGARPREALDIYAPESAAGGAQAAPVMIFIHGGGWRRTQERDPGGRSLRSRAVAARGA